MSDVSHALASLKQAAIAYAASINGEQKSEPDPTAPVSEPAVEPTSEPEPAQEPDPVPADAPPAPVDPNAPPVRTE